MQGETAQSAALQEWALRDIWASVPTPLEVNGNLNLSAVPPLVEHYASALGLSGIYCNGLMGEGWLLTLDERKALLTATTDAAGERLKVGVVVTAGSPRETIELAEHAEKVGADHIVVSPPPGHYSVDEIIRYVELIGASVSLPLVVVQTSSGGFTLPTIERLASETDTVSAIKLGASQDNLDHLLRRFGDRLTITDPLEASWLGNMQAVGMKVLYADPEPYLFQTPDSQPIKEYFRAFLSGDHQGATELSQRLSPVRKLYDHYIMQPLLSGVSPIGALKAWCEYLGMNVGPPRQPISHLDPTIRQELYQALSLVGYLPNEKSP